MTVDKGVRLANFIVDIIILVVLILSLTLVIYYNFYPQILDDNSISFEIVFSGITFCYYFLLEHFYGQTIGKMVTKTKVVDKNGNKPTIGRLILRTVLS
jgi:uncharacterized RDD family membrane protein YckC